jgi:hypothetical protein
MFARFYQFRSGPRFSPFRPGFDLKSTVEEKLAFSRIACERVSGILRFAVRGRRGRIIRPLSVRVAWVRPFSPWARIALPFAADQRREAAALFWARPRWETFIPPFVQAVTCDFTLGLMDAIGRLEPINAASGVRALTDCHSDVAQTLQPRMCHHQARRIGSSN